MREEGEKEGEGEKVGSLISCTWTCLLTMEGLHLLYPVKLGEGSHACIKNGRSCLGPCLICCDCVFLLKKKVGMSRGIEFLMCVKREDVCV